MLDDKKQHNLDVGLKHRSTNRVIHCHRSSLKDIISSPNQEDEFDQLRSREFMPKLQPFHHFSVQLIPSRTHQKVKVSLIPAKLHLNDQNVLSLKKKLKIKQEQKKNHQHGIRKVLQSKPMGNKDWPNRSISPQNAFTQQSSFPLQNAFTPQSAFRQQTRVGSRSQIFKSMPTEHKTSRTSSTAGNSARIYRKRGDNVKRGDHVKRGLDWAECIENEQNILRKITVADMPMFLLLVAKHEDKRTYLNITRWATFDSDNFADPQERAGGNQKESVKNVVYSIIQ